MTVLVLGAGGLLGSNVIHFALKRGHKVIGTYHSEPPAFEIPTEKLAIEQTDSFRKVLNQYSPDIVVNCAAMTDVDACEADPEAALQVNGRAPGQLADLCFDRGVDFVQVSTDYVFDGKHRTPYTESATAVPIQEYGRSKLAGERAVIEADGSGLIVRLSFVWGVHRSTGELTGFPAWVQNRLTAGETTPLFTDQSVSPSRAGTTGETILDLVAREQKGLFHVAARSCVTPYKFGLALCQQLGEDPSFIQEGQLSAVERPAERPRYTCLDVEKVESTLGHPQPTLSDDLRTVASLL